MLIIYMRDVDLLRPSEGGWAPLIFLLLLIVCEIVPIVVLMDYSFMTIFEFDRTTTREMPLLPQLGTAFEQTEADKSSLIAAQEPLLSNKS